jgi:hypothetical protein
MSTPGDRTGGPRARQRHDSWSARAAVRAAAAGLVLSAGLAACSSAPPPSTRTANSRPPNAVTFLGLHLQPPIGPPPVVNGPSSLRLPLDGYYLSSREQLKIFEAERVAEQACIHRYLPGVALGGFGRLVMLFPPIEPLTYLTAGQAARFGYHDPTALALATANAVPVRGAALTEAEGIYFGSMRTFGGLAVPSGGCDVAGIQVVVHGIRPSLVPDGMGQPGTVTGDANLINQQVLQDDSRIKAVNTQWSACIAAHGYRYASPVAAQHNSRWGIKVYTAPRLVPVTPLEIQTAVADVGCRARENVYGVYWAVTAAYQQEWLARPQNMALAQAQEKADQVMLARSEQILAG